MAASFAAGWLLHPPPPPAAPALVEPAPTAAPVDVATCPPCDDDALEACRRALEATEALAKMQEVQHSGTPTPFPDDLPDAFRPEPFAANVAQAVEECGVTPPEFVACEEYPCFVAFSGEGARDTLKSCDWWNERYPQQAVSFANGNIFTEDGPQGYELVGEWAPGVESPLGRDNHHKRFQVRIEEMRLELMARWDGYEPTEEEELAARIAFWQRLADEGEEGAARMVEMLQQQQQAP